MRITNAEKIGDFVRNPILLSRPFFFLRERKLFSLRLFYRRVIAKFAARGYGNDNSPRVKLPVDIRRPTVDTQESRFKGIVWLKGIVVVVVAAVGFEDVLGTVVTCKAKHYGPAVSGLRFGVQDEMPEDSIDRFIWCRSIAFGGPSLFCWRLQLWSSVF